MIERKSIVVISELIFLILFYLTLLSFSQQNRVDHHARQIQNHPPVVKILSPKNNSSYSLNAQVAYQVSVSDKEDGESKYQEINPKEVFLKIQYLKDTAQALELVRKNQDKEPEAISIIKTSNCMNCHAFKTKLIGPSFYDITHRYKLISATEDTLINHILDGSKGRWGNVQMPSNNKLHPTEAKKVINWIFNNAGDSTVNYLAGTEGSFRLNPPAPSLKYAMVIATYTDHGLKDTPGQNLKGQDIIILYIK